MRSDLRTRAIETVVASDRQFGVFGCSGDRFVYSVDSPAPVRLWISRGAADAETQISDLNPW